MENFRVIISGLSTYGTGDGFRWSLVPGQAWNVSGGAEESIRVLLDCLAGRSSDKSLAVRLEPRSGTAGLLPPPGEEIFVGTTIGEQLDFFSHGDSSVSLEKTGLDRLFGFGFGLRRGESVWELGSGERRCLLLVSQALAEPHLWVLHRPLDRMDGPRAAAMREFIRLRRGLGNIVVASQEPAPGMLDCCTNFLALGDGGLNVEFSGDGRRAVEYLAGAQGLPSRYLELLLEKR